MATSKHNLQGGYRYLPGIEPYSCGVAADASHEIVHATLKQPQPWLAGLHAVRRHLESIGRHCHALCGVELRCPEPMSFDGFAAFNEEYRSLLDEWDLLVDGDNPIARTNVSPVVNPPTETQLFGFSCTVPSKPATPTFVVAGGGELRDGGLHRDAIVREGETSSDALIEKATRVAEIMSERLDCLGNGEHLSTIDVYGQYPLHGILADVIIPAIPAAAALGVRWFLARPPILGIEFEMDMRGVQRELVVDLRPAT